MHEQRFHDQSSFITLTYEDKHLPRDQSLVKSHWQLFMKRLRKAVNGTEPQYLDNARVVPNPKFTEIKFMMCGEYGSEEHTQRPHYHAIVFGYHPSDKKVFKHKDGIITYSSDELDNIWGLGYSTTGDVTFESAAYVARYTMKKINGNLREKINPETGLRPYERVHLDTGEIWEVLPEFALMSRGGRNGRGLGYSFFRKYQADIYPWDEVIVNAHPQRPPRYYDSLFEEKEPEIFETIKELRCANMEKHKKDNTRARLAQREKVKLAQISKLKRNEEKL